MPARAAAHRAAARAAPARHGRPRPATRLVELAGVRLRRRLRPAGAAHRRARRRRGRGPAAVGRSATPRRSRPACAASRCCPATSWWPPTPARHPWLCDLPPVVDGHVGAYLGVPLPGRRRQLVGALCAYDARAPGVVRARRDPGLPGRRRRRPAPAPPAAEPASGRAAAPGRRRGPRRRRRRRAPRPPPRPARRGRGSAGSRAAAPPAARRTRVASRAACRPVRCRCSRASAASRCRNVASTASRSAPSARAYAPSHSSVSMTNATRWPGRGSLTSASRDAARAGPRAPACRRPGPRTPAGASRSGSSRHAVVLHEPVAHRRHPVGQRRRLEPPARSGAATCPRRLVRRLPVDRERAAVGREAGQRPTAAPTALAGQCSGTGPGQPVEHHPRQHARAGRGSGRRGRA